MAIAPIAGASCTGLRAPPPEERARTTEGHRPARPPPASTGASERPRGIAVAPLPGWPKWLGEANHQVSGLAFREGHLYAVSDQSGVEKRALLEIGLGGDASERSVPVRVVCRWTGGPHPDAEGLAIDPLSGSPRTLLIPLESEADALIEVAFDGCRLQQQYGPLTGRSDNQGIEGVAVSPDGRTVYLVHETREELLTLGRGGPGPAHPIRSIAGARSLCDVAYDDRATAGTEDDRLLLLDRNGLQIFATTLSGETLARWRLDERVFGLDPDGAPYGLVAFEGLAIEGREPEGSVLVYAATDTPPAPFPYARKDGADPGGLYARRVGMLYRFELSEATSEPR